MTDPPPAAADDDPGPEAPPARVVMLVMGLVSAALAATVPALPLWLDHLGVHDPVALATYTAAAFGGGVVASMIATPLWGALGDRTSHRAMIVRACVGLAIGQALMALAAAPWQVVAIRVGQGLVSGVEPALYAWAVVRHGETGTGTAIGRLEAASTAGALVGPIAMAGVLLSTDIARLFLGAAAVAAVAAALVRLAVPPDPPHAPAAPRRRLLDDLRGAARGPGVPGLLATVGVVVALDAVVELLYPLLVVLHTTAGPERVLLLGAVEIAGEGAYLLAAPALGALVDRRGPRSVMIPCVLLSGLATAIAPWVPLPWLWVGLVAVGDGASSGVRAALYAEVPRRGHAAHRGTVMSLVSSANRAGAAAASAVVPLAVATLGLAAAMTAAGLATAALAGQWARRPRAPAVEAPPAED